jgi:hypothetical protein
MHEGMGGQHLFVIDVATNDPAKPLVNLKVKSNWMK